MPLMGTRRYRPAVYSGRHKQSDGCPLIGGGLNRGFTAAEKTELWDRWKRGQSLKAIGRAFGKPSSSIYFLVARLTIDSHQSQLVAQRPSRCHDRSSDAPSSAALSNRKCRLSPVDGQSRRNEG